MPSTPKKLPSGSWRCLAYLGKDAGGKLIRKSVTRPTKAEARAAAVAMEAEREEPASGSDLTVKQAVRAYLDSRANIHSPSTRRNNELIYSSKLGKISDSPIRALTSADMQEYINGLAESYSPKTIRNVYGLISSSIHYASPDKHLSVHLPKPEAVEIQIPTLEQIQAVQALADERGDNELYLAIMLASQLGLREGEICALTFADVAGGNVHVTKSRVKTMDGSLEIKPPKSRSGVRTIPQTPQVAEALSRFQGAPGDLIIPTAPDAMSARFAKARAKLGYTFRFHDLRHYNASLMISMGVPIFYIVRRMGHEDDKMIKRVYGHMMEHKQEEINDKMADFFK